MTVTYIAAATTSINGASAQENLPSGVTEGDFLVALIRSGANYLVTPQGASPWVGLPIKFSNSGENLTVRASAYRSSLYCSIFIREYKASEGASYWGIGGYEVGNITILAFRGSGGKLYLDDFDATTNNDTCNIGSDTTGAVIVAGVSGAAFGMSPSNLTGISKVYDTSFTECWLKDGHTGNVSSNPAADATCISAYIKVIEAQKNIRHIDTYHMSSSTGGSIWLPEPTHTKAGDVIFAMVMTANYYFTAGVAPPAGAGWVLLDYRDGADPFDPDKKYWTGLYAKVATVNYPLQVYWDTAAEMHRVAMSSYRGKFGLCAYSYIGNTQSSTTGTLLLSLSAPTPNGEGYVAIVNQSQGNPWPYGKGGYVQPNLKDSDTYKTAGTSYPASAYNGWNFQYGWGIKLSAPMPSANSNPFFKHNF